MLLRALYSCICAGFRLRVKLTSGTFLCQLNHSQEVAEGAGVLLTRVKALYLRHAEGFTSSDVQLMCIQHLIDVLGYRLLVMQRNCYTWCSVAVSVKIVTGKCCQQGFEP